MKYYQLLFDYEKYDGATCIMAKDIESINRYDIDRGKKIENWPENFTFYYNSEETNEFIDCQGNDLGWFVISLRFKKIIEELQIQYVNFLPVKIINEKDNSIREDYFVVNIFNNIERAMDYDNSKYIGQIPSREELFVNPTRVYVRIYALKEKAISQFDLFRIKEKWITPIFISEKFKKAVEKNKITGCDFGKVIVV